MEKSSLPKRPVRHAKHLVSDRSGVHCASEYKTTGGLSMTPVANRLGVVLAAVCTVFTRSS